MSTTSCFAPRNMDNIIELAKLAKIFNVPHVINNAYGLQSTYINSYIQTAQREGRVDLFVQSSDKNLMVPVGGAIVAGFDKDIVHNVAKTYAGIIFIHTILRSASRILLKNLIPRSCLLFTIIRCFVDSTFTG